MKEKIGLIAVLIVLALSAKSAMASGYQPLRVQPSRFIFEARPGESISGTIEATNTGNGSISPSVALNDWTLDETMKVTLFEGGSLADSTLQNWIEFSPNRFDLGPSDMLKVNFTIRVPADALPGERRGMLAFEQLIPMEAGATGAAAKVAVTSTIYVSVIPVERKCEIESMDLVNDLSAGTGLIKVRLRGMGSAHFRGTAAYEVRREGGGAAIAEGRFPSFIVLPGGAAEITGQLGRPLEAGRYEATVRIESADNPQGAVNRTSIILYKL